MAVNNELSGTYVKGYVLKKVLGKGSFGIIYEAHNEDTDEVIAVKVERANNRFLQLNYEYRILRYLDSIEGFPITKFYSSTKEHNFMGLEKLGSNLEELFNMNHRAFSMKTICMLAIEMIKRIECVHAKGLLHRDIKPDNFLIGAEGNEDKIYLIDFGLSKRYKENKSGLHIPYRDDKSLTGTARYASINAHRGIEQSRRDDAEALGFVLVYFARGGKLPWQGMKHERRSRKYEMIMEKKSRTPIRTLCRNIPKCFSLYLEHVRVLKFESRPDYSYLTGLFYNEIKQNGLSKDMIFDWIQKPQNQGDVDIKTAEKVKPKRCC